LLLGLVANAGVHLPLRDMVRMAVERRKGEKGVWSKKCAKICYCLLQLFIQPETTLPDPTCLFGYGSSFAFGRCHIDPAFDLQLQCYWYNLTLWLTNLPNIFYCVTNPVKLLKQPQFFWRSSCWTDLAFSNVTLLIQPRFATSVVIETSILLRTPHY
jgi:hypothetical protein